MVQDIVAHLCDLGSIHLSDMGAGASAMSMADRNALFEKKLAAKKQADQERKRRAKASRPVVPKAAECDGPVKAHHAQAKNIDGDEIDVVEPIYV